MRLGPADLLIQAGKAQAAFFILDGALAFDDAGLRKTSSHSGLLGIAGDVHDQKLKRQGHLRGGQAEPLGLVHQLLHGADVEVQLACRHSAPAANDAAGPDVDSERFS